MSAFTHDELVAAMQALQPAPPPLPNYIPTNVAGSLLTTMHDYCAFLARILAPGGGAGELSAVTRERMLSPQIRLNHALAWGLGWGIETMSGQEYIWHWGDNGTFKNFVLAHLPSRSAVVVFTNAAQGMRLAEGIVNEASGPTTSRSIGCDIRDPGSGIRNPVTQLLTRGNKPLDLFPRLPHPSCPGPD